MKLIYVVSGIDSAFSSQVIALVNQIAKHDKIVKIDLCIGLKNNELIPDFELEPKIELHKFLRYPDYPFLINLTARELKKVFCTLNISEKTVIHTRNELTGWLAQKALKMLNKKANLLVDVRGTIREELTDFFRGSVLAKRLKLFMLGQIREIYQQADVINTVSDSLKKYLLKEFQVLEEKIFTIPCSANSTFFYDSHQREAIRSQYDIDKSDTVVVFASGGANLWQKTDEIVLSIAEKGYIVFNLSKQVIDHPKVISIFVPYSEMPKYLSAADIGIIIREHHVVNKVASPIKFAEYLACGLPVIANDSVEQIVDTIQAYNVGIVMEDVDSVTDEMVESLLRLDRRQTAMIGSQLFGIENISSAYLKIYQKLLGENQ